MFEWHHLIFSYFFTSDEPFLDRLNPFNELARLFVSRREHAEEPAVPVELGLDLLGEGALRGRRGGEVPGGGAETSGLPGGNLLR